MVMSLRGAVGDVAISMFAASYDIERDCFATLAMTGKQEL
jgi:hypothetical protein